MVPLSSEELAQAGRFRFERHRRRFVARRFGLRSVLGGYLGIAPEDVQYRPGVWGKLDLQNRQNTSLSFNSSHSENRALVAIAAGGRVGVDIERMREMADYEAIAQRFFSAREQDAVRSLDPEQRVLGFFQCWTRKEAFVKALGLGLHFPLDSFDVSVGPQERPAILRLGDDAAPGRVWSLAQPEAPTGFVAALAVDHPIGDVVYRDGSAVDELSQ